MDISKGVQKSGIAGARPFAIRAWLTPKTCSSPTWNIMLHVSNGTSVPLENWATRVAPYKDTQNHPKQHGSVGYI